MHLVHICHFSSVSHVFFSSYVQAERDVIEKIFIKQVDLKQMKTYNNFLDIHSKKKKNRKNFLSEVGFEPTPTFVDQNAHS